MDVKDKSSRSGSRANLNESTLPLLDDLATDHGLVDKENIEMKEKSSVSSVVVDEEKDDSRTEKEKQLDGGSSGDGVTVVVDDKDNPEDGNGKDKKGKKGKKASNHQRSPSCVQTMTIGLNVLDRDEKRVNDHINIQFDDVVAEPDASHSFDGVWRLAFVVFSGTKFWLYRVLTAVIALPCAVVWGIIFALVTLLHVWAVTPILRTFDLGMFLIKRLWSGLVHTICDPIFESLGMFFANVHVHHHRSEPIA